MVPIEDLRLLEQVEDRIDIEEARRALKESGKNISLAEVKRRLGLVIRARLPS